LRSKSEGEEENAVLFAFASLGYSKFALLQPLKKKNK